MSTKRPHTDDSGDVVHATGPPPKKCRNSESKGSLAHDADTAEIWRVIRSNWSNLDEIKRLVVFGDSSTRRGNNDTWLGHFLRSLNSHGNQVQAHCYAEPGNTVEDDMADQISSFFEQFAAKSDPKATPSLEPNSTLYVLWLGINDCGHSDSDDLDEIVEKLFEDGLEELHMKAGARKFLLFDVPPKDRSPSGLTQEANLSERYQHWNEELMTHAKSFTSEYNILDNPEEYGFQEDDVSQESGGIWADDLHLTSEAHAILAEHLEQALRTADRTANSP